MPDLQFSNPGPFVLCTPMTDVGADWLASNIVGEVTMIGGSLIVEHRYLENVVLGARTDGLICEG